MEEILVFALVWGAMVATSFWEAYVEGKHPWDKGKLGWKIHCHGYVVLTAYHFWLFWVTFPLLLLLPFVFVDFSWRLLGMLASAYLSGLVIEDFCWFIVNPAFDFRNFNSAHVKWYPWLKLGKFEVPVSYVTGILLAILIWVFVWK